MNTRPLALIAVGALAAGGALAAAGAGAADHLDAPGVEADGRTDINDLYAFAGSRAGTTALIMTVNPAVGVFSGSTFHPDADYVFNIDQDGDAIADQTATVRFADVRADGSQRFQVKLGNRAVANGSTGETTRIRGGGQATAGTFEDPFFFDLNGFNNGFQFTGSDFFAGLDVSAIVLEVPTRWVGGNVGIWATTSVDGQQVDRIGRPAINTALIPSSQKNAYNQADPVNDPDEYADEMAATTAFLLGLVGYPAEGIDAYAATVADVLTPDVLTYDTSQSAGYLNGRTLSDDVIDTSLSVLTGGLDVTFGGALTGDGVNENDATFPGVFPYLAPAND